MKIEFPERFNMADYFLYHNVEEGRDARTCLFFKDETYTYGDAVQLSNQAGNALRALGVGMEDRVLIALPDCPEFVWTWFGTSKIGAVVTMVNPLLHAADYKYYLEYTRARVAVISEPLIETFTEAIKMPSTCGRRLWWAKSTETFIVRSINIADAARISARRYAPR
jgi:benzoate-CoA ligase